MRRAFVPGLLVAALTALVAVPGFAQTVAVQGALRTNTGGPFADGKYTLTVALYSKVDDAKSAWSEIHVALPVTGGTFAFQMGARDPEKTHSRKRCSKPAWRVAKVLGSA
jgi:uncharacterized protein YdeI (BOF family)